MSQGSRLNVVRYFSGVALMIALVSLAPIAASAAPQALGLVATRDAMPLQCNGDTCVGFLSSFCLEEERMPPVARRAYKPAANSKITLIVETGDGRTIHLPGQEYLSFNVRLDFTSILAKVSLSRLAAFSPSRVSVHIGPLATLMPTPVAGDTGLHSPDELKLVTGPYRRTGNRFFDESGATGETVSMMTQMINRLPRLARAPKEARVGSLGDVLNGADGRASGDGARQRFQAIVEGCENMLTTTKRINMRACLTYRHEVMQTKANRQFWWALGGV